jgi:hypothetical protein
LSKAREDEHAQSDERTAHGTPLVKGCHGNG